MVKIFYKETLTNLKKMFRNKIILKKKYMSFFLF